MKRSIFDEFGQKIGEIEMLGNGEGLFDAIAGTLALIVLWTFGFVVYAFCKLMIVLYKTREGKLILVGVVLLLLMLGLVALQTQQQYVDSEIDKIKVISLREDFTQGTFYITLHNTGQHIVTTHSVLIIDMDSDDGASASCTGSVGELTTVIPGGKTAFVCRIKPKYISHYTKDTVPTIRLYVYEDDFGGELVGSGYRKIR